MVKCGERQERRMWESGIESLSTWSVCVYIYICICNIYIHILAVVQSALKTRLYWKVM